MNALSRFVCASALLFSLSMSPAFQGVAFGESRPQKTLEPKFFVGCPVLWSDGSRGVVLERSEYRDDEWYYLVRLGGEDGLCWTLPEAGLRFRSQEAGVSRAVGSLIHTHTVSADFILMAQRPNSVKIRHSPARTPSPS